MAKSRNRNKNSEDNSKPRINLENEKRRKEVRRFKRNKSIKDWGLTFLVVFCVVGGGYFFLKMISSSHDLSRIGKGLPMVVQVHLDNCQPCRELQRETKQAMTRFDKSELGYVVADLSRPHAAIFARAHGAGQTTLLLFDGRGKMKRELYGVRSAAALEQIFKEALRVETKS